MSTSAKICRGLVLGGLSLMVAACEQRPIAMPAVAANPAVSMTPESVFDSYVAQKTGVSAGQVDPGLKATLRTEFDRLRSAAAAEAPKATLQTLAAIEVQRIELLAQAGAEAAGVYTQPTDAELQAEYAKYVAGLPAREFHIAHILVPTEDLARSLLGQLHSGGDFARLARTQSADASSTKGGDIGWIAPGKLPPELTDAVKALKPGDVALQPIHSIYGWHVIKLLDSRPASAPSFDQVKPQLVVNLQQERNRQFLESVGTGVDPSSHP